MADTSALPSLPTTVDISGAQAQIEGDPIEYMQTHAREHIETIESYPALQDIEKKEFKVEVLKKLKENIQKCGEIDKKYAEQKAEEEKAKEGKEEEEEDPFADIFKDDAAKPDEATQEKSQIAAQFVVEIKIYKEKFLKTRLKKHENQSIEKENEKLDDILGKLNQV